MAVSSYFDGATSCYVWFFVKSVENEQTEKGMIHKFNKKTTFIRRWPIKNIYTRYIDFETTDLG